MLVERAAGIQRTSPVRAPARPSLDPPFLQVPEAVHEPAAPEVNLERRGVVRRRTGGMSVALPVELPQLVQLMKELFDHDCVATLLLLV